MFNKICLMLIWFTMTQISFGEVVLEDIRCNGLNKEVLKVVQCRMKYEHGSRGKKEGFANIQLLQTMSNVTLKIKFMKKSNNDYNIYFTKEIFIDGCKFLLLRESPLIRYIFQFLEPYSNLNHTCPYEGEIIVQNLKVDQNKIKYLPIPEGHYAFFTMWSCEAKPCLDLRFYIAVM